jgi:hypothetical protein
VLKWRKIFGGLHKNTYYVAYVRWSSVALLLLFCCSSLPLLTKKNTALCQAMCQKTSLKGSHEKRKYQFRIEAKRRKSKGKSL